MRLQHWFCCHDFEIIDPKEGSSSFAALVGRTWGRNMKASISLDKERIKLKGNGQKFIVPIHPSQGEPWTEPIDDEVDVRQLYQIQNNADYTEHNIYGELHLGNQDSVIIQTQNYMIRRSRTMKHKQEGSGLFKKYRKIPPNSAS